VTAKVGEPAPEFALLDADRNTVTLSQFRGHNVVLAFYVLAFTGGCRNELMAFRDLHADFLKANAEVLGISVDTFPSVGSFARSLNLNFPMLSDFPENKATKAYGTYNAAQGVSRRVTFVVDSEGILRGEIVSDEDMARHADESLALVREVEGTGNQEQGTGA
jgi:peroxiredoxin